jgi:hypothetical protein
VRFAEKAAEKISLPSQLRDNAAHAIVRHQAANIESL